MASVDAGAEQQRRRVEQHAIINFYDSHISQCLFSEQQTELQRWDLFEEA